MILNNTINSKIHRSASPDISVIIPFYNVEDYIEECLDSVIAQKGVRTEIILVDDGSTDGSVEIVKDFIRRYKNISLYHEDEKGPGAARNLGVKYASGEFIAFADADDILKEGIYERMYKTAKHNDADICICHVARLDGTKKVPSDLHERVFRDYKLCTNIRESYELIHDTTVWNKLINRNFYLENGITFPEGIVYEDIYVNDDLHDNCSRVAMVSEIGYLWRIRKDPGKESITQKFYSDNNIRDRFSAARWLLEDFCARDLPEGLKKEAQYKLLHSDLKLILDSVEYVPDDRALQIMAEVRDFVKDHIDDDVMETASIQDMQRYDCANRGDLEGLRKLLVYTREAYDKAPVTERDGKLYAELPEDIFKVKKRDLKDEFSRMRRKVWVDDISIADGGFNIDAHIYIPRYNMKDPEDQSIEITLVNEETGHTVNVDARPKETKHITKLRGTVKDPVSEKVTEYNYDFTGFSFFVDPEMFSGRDKKNALKYSVVAGYKDRMFSGSQILRGISRDIKSESKKMRIKKGGRTLSVDFGYMNELQIIVKDRFSLL